MKRNEQAKATHQVGRVDSFDVSRVRDTTAGVFFTLTLNGVDINNCHVVEMKNGNDFISFPATKGKDGKYYNVCYFRFSDEDQQAVIASVEAALEK